MEKSQGKTLKIKIKWKNIIRKHYGKKYGKKNE